MLTNTETFSEAWAITGNNRLTTTKSTRLKSEVFLMGLQPPEDKGILLQPSSFKREYTTKPAPIPAYRNNHGAHRSLNFQANRPPTHPPATMEIINSKILVMAGFYTGAASMSPPPRQRKKHIIIFFIFVRTAPKELGHSSDTADVAVLCPEGKGDAVRREMQPRQRFIVEIHLHPFQMDRRYFQPEDKEGRL